MPIRIEILDLVPEDKLVETVALFSASAADIVTAINDNHNTFTVEATFFDNSAAGSAIALDGKMSTFGGPDDHGVGPNEGLSLFEAEDLAANPDLFLPMQPPGTTGLARRLNPQAKYLACRWNLSVTPKSFLKLATTIVKVTNPANGQTQNARPADTGPAVFTGRVTDLSPGLAASLHLNTDDVCHLEIPTPAGAQLPAGAGIAVGVNPASIDATVFPDDMNRKLVAFTTFDKTSHWVINQVGPHEGGQSLLRRKGNNTEILLSDTTVFPVKASDKVPAAVAAELNKAHPELVSSGGPGGPAPQAGDDINGKMFVSTQAFVGHDTSGVPGTDHGNLACAWAVNQVARLALGKPISTDGGGKNGLGTSGMFDILKAHHAKLNSANESSAGTVIIAPTVGANHGHVGIVGQNNQVFSNKSVPGVFTQNFTVQSFTNRYVGKGLQVLFFNLKGDQFV
jgi:hypothetical protein